MNSSTPHSNTGQRFLHNGHDYFNATGHWDWPKKTAEPTVVTKEPTAFNKPLESNDLQGGKMTTDEQNKEGE